MRMSDMVKKISSVVLSVLICCAFSVTFGVENAFAAVPTPGQVTGVKATSKCTSVKLSWRASKNATGYTVYKGTSKVGSTSKRNYSVTKLREGTKYSFKVRAYKKYYQTQYFRSKDGKSGAWVTKKPSLKYWKGKKTRKVKKYKYGKYSAVKSVTTRKHSYTVTGSTTATFWEDGIDTLKCSRCGACKNIVTGKAGMNKDLGVKTQIVRTETDKYGVLVTWNNAPEATGYEVEKSTDGQKYTQEYYSSVNQYYDELVSDGNIYYYRITAYKTDAEKKVVFASKESESFISVETEKYIKNDPAYDETANTYKVALEDEGVLYTIKINGKTVTDKQEINEYLIENVNPGKTYEITIEKYECYKDPVPETGVIPEPEYIGGKNSTITIPIRKTEISPNKEAETVTLDAPVITKVEPTATTLNIIWDKVSGAREYEVLIFDEKGIQIGAATTVSTSYTQEELTPQIGYSIKIAAKRGDKVSPAESVIQRTLKLDTPKNIKASATKRSLTFTWDNVTGARMYRIYKDGAKLADVEKGASSTTSYTVEGLTPESEYVYTIKAGNNGKYSDAAEMKGTTRPYVEAPTGVTADIGLVNMTLSWDPVEDATGYYVYLPDGSRAEAGSTSYEVSGLNPKTEYTFKISAHDNIGHESAKTTITKKTGELKAPTITSITTTVDSITVKWGAVPGITKYYVYKTDNTRYETTSTSYTESGLKPGTEYTVKVATTDGDGHISTKSIATKSTLSLKAPTGLTATADQDTFKLKWDAVTNAKKYKVYVNGAPYKEVTGTSCTVEKFSYSYNNGSGLNEGTVTFEPDRTYSISVAACVGNYESSKASVSKRLPSFGQTFPLKKNITLHYGDADIYLGQQWSSSIKTALEKGSSGTETVTRKQGVEATNFRHYDETVYMIDIGDYDNFLVVYVADGQIIGWQTTAPTFGTHNGKTYKKGDNVKDSVYGEHTEKTNVGSVNNAFPDYETGDSIIGGFAISYFPVDGLRTAEGEKRVGFHLINAFRVAANLNPLIYNKYLDGGTSTWSGTISGKTYTNVRYGAQAMAETITASDKISHAADTMTKGPLAGIGSTTRHEITWEASGRKVHPGGNENVGTGCSGETFLGVYLDSNGHIAEILNPEHKYIGLGTVISPNGNNCEQFSD